MKNISNTQLQRVKQNRRLECIRVMNFINEWKRKFDKLKKRRFFKYGENVKSTLNLTYKEQYSVSETFEQGTGTSELVLDDNIASNNQVKLVALKSVESQRGRRFNRSADLANSVVLDVKSTKLGKHGKNKYKKNDYTRPSTPKIQIQKQDTSSSESDEIKKHLQTKKRIISHSEEYEHVYKNINWQDWTMSDEPTKHYNTYDYKKPKINELKTPSILIEEVGEESFPESEFLSSTHNALTNLDRLSRMYLDLDEDDLDSHDGDEAENKENSNSNKYMELKVPEYSLSDNSKFTFPDSYQNSLKSSEDSHRGSLQSRSSISSYSNTMRRPSPVPMNFIPGQTKPIITRRERVKSVTPLNDVVKATFCFKGITCQVERSKPRTSKAIVHMGMMIISILGPTEHNCSH